MAENKQSFGDGIGRQEEEVRDLFNLLTKKGPADQPPMSAPAPVEAAPDKVEELVLPDAPAAEVDAPAVSIEIPAALEEIEPVQEPISPQMVSAFFATHERRSPVIDEYDEEDMFLELPPLVLTPYDGFEDDDEADEYDYYGNFILPDDGEEDGYEIDEAPAERRNPLVVFWSALRGNVPLPCDSKQEIVRKSAFWLSLVLIVGALTYILYNVWWLPSFTKDMYTDLAQEYRSEVIDVVADHDDSPYPQQMQLSFRTLYDRNKEIRGWLSFHASGNQDFLNIEYPIMYSGDNEKYLTIDFNGNKNKNGALFFDMRAKLNSAEDSNTSLIVYGHNMASGQMLAGLNKFIGNVNNARVAPTMTMNTLFANGHYKVFAVVITDESAQQHYFNVRRTQFTDEEDFLNYIENLRARSLFDYPVDVQAGDELLLLSTCTVPSSAKIDDGRLTVIARKVRSGESTAVNTSAIVKNGDVIMPYAWYTLQNKQPHAYYKGGVIIAPSTTTTTTTTVGEIDRDEMTSDADSSTSASDNDDASSTSADGSSTSGSTTLTTAATSSGTPSAESTTTTTESTTTETTTTTTTAAE